MARKSRVAKRTVNSVENEVNRTDAAMPDTNPNSHASSARKSLLHRHPLRSAALIGLLLIGIVLAIPQTRYPILGAFLDRPVRLQVVDAQTGKPVSAADITTPAGSVATTDADGQVSLKLPVGENSLTVKKANYADGTLRVFVGVSRTITDPFQLTATGRQVQVMAANRISGKPLEKAVFKSGDVEAISDASGKAVMVVPAGEDTIDVSLSAEGYNATSTKLTVTESTEVDKTNQFALTPSGKVYFLSKRSGRIDVVKSDLDGKNRKVVLRGTGKESDSDTVLLASRDWKYLTLKSKRDGGKYAKLFLIDTTNDSLTLMDQGDASFEPIGWSNQYFLYRVSRDSGLRIPGAQRIKSYDAPSRKIVVLASSGGEGTPSHFSYQQFNSTTILSSGLLYSSDWYASEYNRYEGKKAEAVLIQPNGQGKKVLFSLSSRPTSIEIAPYELDGVYIKTDNYLTDKQVFYEYEAGDSKPTVAKIDDEEFYKGYPTFLVSPSGKRVLWSEKRDGKNTLLVGNESAQNAVPIASVSEYAPYGWFTDEYVLVSKDGSELYIRSADKTSTKPVKITDYHKPDTEFEGYGYGYGGL